MNEESSMIERTHIKEIGEVFTPNWLVENTLNLLPIDIWTDACKTWLEPSCGDGNFLVAILERLMMSLKIWQPDDSKRHQHIIEFMLYGIDLMQDNVDTCIKRLDAVNLKHHIICADALTYHYRFDEWAKVDNGNDLFIWPEKIR